MPIDIGIASLSEHVRTSSDGRMISAAQRMQGLVDLAVLAEQMGLDSFAVGEHHSPEFVVSSPAVMLAAVAARTTRLRLGSAVTVLSALDPVRVYEDFATLDLLSAGRAEITVGRGAFVEPFEIFGVPTEAYDDAFAEKLDLLLRINQQEKITWNGRFRTPLRDAEIAPRPVQPQLPIWIGIGGTPASAQRAGRLGLPMVIGSLGMPMHHIVQLAAVYREAGSEHPERLRLGIGGHLHLTANDAETQSVYPFYRDFLGPKRPGRPGLHITREHFAAGFQPHSTRYIGTATQVEDKLLALHEAVRFDRFQGLAGWGGLSFGATQESLQRFADHVVPALRKAADSAPVAPGRQR